MRRKFAAWLLAAFLVVAAVGWACGTERGGTGIRALLRGVPTHCSHGVLTVQVTSQLQGAVNVYHVPRYGVTNIHSADRLVSQVTSRGATETMCLDPLLGKRARIAVDPVGADPYLIPHAGATFFDGTSTLIVRVMKPITLSTLEVY